MPGDRSAAMPRQSLAIDLQQCPGCRDYAGIECRYSASGQAALQDVKTRKGILLAYILQIFRGFYDQFNSNILQQLPHC